MGLSRCDRKLRSNASQNARPFVPRRESTPKAVTGASNGPFEAPVTALGVDSLRGTNGWAFLKRFPWFRAILPLNPAKNASVPPLSAMGGFTTFAFYNRSVALFGGCFSAWRVFLNQKNSKKILQLYQERTIYSLPPRLYYSYMWMFSHVRSFVHHRLALKATFVLSGLYERGT